MNLINKKRKKGFTLIELIVVIAIMAILAAVAVPNFIGITDSARKATENGAAAEYANAINIHNATATTRITTKPETLAALDTALGTLKPTLSADINSANVFAKIVVTDSVATIDKDAVAAPVT